MIIYKTLGDVNLDLELRRGIHRVAKESLEQINNQHNLYNETHLGELIDQYSPKSIADSRFNILGGAFAFHNSNSEETLAAFGFLADGKFEFNGRELEFQTSNCLSRNGFLYGVHVNPCYSIHNKDERVAEKIIGQLMSYARANQIRTVQTISAHFDSVLNSYYDLDFNEAGLAVVKINGSEFVLAVLEKKLNYPY